MVTLPSSDSSQLQHSEPATDNQRFNWQTCWYPIAFVVDIPSDRPYRFSIFAEPFVLFRDSNNTWVCLVDRCPHRLAKLSDGRVIEGRLECLYHGWQFGQKGECLHIPQLLEGATIPERASVASFPVKEHQGVIWVWADTEISPDPELPPTVDNLEDEGVFKVDTATDLPFDYTFLVENFIDPAHVYISHDRTELGIRREDARPLIMEVLSTSVAGMEGRYRRADKPQAPWTSLTFQAPMTVHYSFTNPAYGVIGGFALYALPLDYGQSRVLVRRYGNIFKPSFKRTPRWLEHLRQNKLLEEDLPFIVEQERFFRETNQPLKTAYFPLKTSDIFIIEYRRWLDRFGQDLPWYVGFATTKLPPADTIKPLPEKIPSRFERHTQHCQACFGAYQRFIQIKQAGQILAVITLALAVALEGQFQTFFALSFVLSAITVVVSDRLRTRLEKTYQHHP
ncbi:MAG: Rieske 2Fe-2S domain-containing protein [Cyanobacteria bacterium J06592_8]